MKFILQFLKCLAAKPVARTYQPKGEGKVPKAVPNLISGVMPPPK
jgi:hypothetical protein